MEYAIEPGLYPKIKADFVMGKGSIRELCTNYNVEDDKAVQQRAWLEKWTEERKNYLESIYTERLENRKLEAAEWEEEVKKTSKREWNYISDSIKSLVDSGQGIDSDNIAGYVRARKTYDDLVRRSLGLVDPSSKVDLTSNGKSLGESLVDALVKLRDGPSEAPAIDLTDEQIEVLRTARIETSEQG